MGRWMSPDWAAKPEAVPYSDLSNPQSLNLYAYVGNNPLSKNDPDGHLEAQWHFFITFAAAITHGRGFFGSLKLAGQTTGVDFRKGSQGTDAASTNMHSMEGTKPDGTVQTKAEADAGTSQVISNAEASGDTALAGHAAEDNATPLYEGYAWSGINGSFFKHFLGDNFPSFGTIRNAFNNEVQVLNGQNPVPAPAPAPPAPAPIPPPPPPEPKPNQQ